jgi:uncharacterized protein
MSGELDDRDLTELLSSVHTIAVVGLSANPSKDSHEVASYLKMMGYRIIPVNPGEDEILGEKSYSDLVSIPEPIDIVDVFRRPEYVPGIADQAVAARAKVLWLQLGIRNDEAAFKARNAGLKVVQDRCLKVEHSRLIG